MSRTAGDPQSPLVSGKESRSEGISTGVRCAGLLSILSRSGNRPSHWSSLKSKCVNLLKQNYQICSLKGNAVIKPGFLLIFKKTRLLVHTRCTLIDWCVLSDSVRFKSGDVSKESLSSPELD